MRHESSTKLGKSVDAVRRLASHIGCDILDPNYRITKRSVVVATILGIGTLFALHSFWSKRDEPLMGLRMGVIFFKVLQLIAKHWNVVTRRHNYPVLLTMLESVLNELQQNPSNEPTLVKHMNRLNFWQKVMINSYRMALLLALISGFMISVVNGEFTLMFDVFIPFVDEKTLLGYATTTACHMMLLDISAAAFPAFDSFFITLCLPIGAFVDAIGNEIRELNQLLAEELPSNRNQAVEKLRRIYRIHQMLVDFETMVDNHYSGHNWILLTTNMVGMVCCIYLAYVNGYLTGYGVFGAMLAQISQYCILGAYVAAKNKRMVENVYTINFYKLPIRHQRMIALMLHRAQNATEMSAGGIVPLDLETYVEVLKGMYSYIAVLTTMVEQE